MKPIKSKQQQREELDSLIDQYLQKGGDVTQCDLGDSGRDANLPLPKPPFIEKSNQQRTLVNDAVQAIEERKELRKQRNKPARPRANQNTKKLLVDDFGEPLRWVWSNNSKDR